MLDCALGNCVSLCSGEVLNCVLENCVSLRSVEPDLRDSIATEFWELELQMTE